MRTNIINPKLLLFTVKVKKTLLSFPLDEADFNLPLNFALALPPLLAYIALTDENTFSGTRYSACISCFIEASSSSAVSNTKVVEYEWLKRVKEERGYSGGVSYRRVQEGGGNLKEKGLQIIAGRVHCDEVCKRSRW